MLENLSNRELTENLKKLVQREREVLNQVLEHLEEMEKRRLYLSLGFSSLFDYCVNELKYSESAAQRRISSMRLVKELPQIKEKISEGKLTLSTLSMVQSFFKREEKEQKARYSSYEKHELLKTLETKSKREVEKELVKISPLSALPKEKERPITPDTVEIKFTLTQEQMEKLKRLKELKPNLLSHQEALEWLLNRALKQIDPMKFAESKESKHKAKDKDINHIEKIGAVSKKVDSPSKLGCERTESSFEMKRATRCELNEAMEIKRTKEINKAISREVNKQANKQVNGLRNKLIIEAEKPGYQKVLVKTQKTPSRKYISKSKKALIWKRAEAQCQYVSLVTKRRCTSRSNLQIDHIRPIGLGGTNEIRNLRLLCQQHNLYEAIQTYGSNKMNAYLKM